MERFDIPNPNEDIKNNLSEKEKMRERAREISWSRIQWYLVVGFLSVAATAFYNSHKMGEAMETAHSSHDVLDKMRKVDVPIDGVVTETIKDQIGINLNEFGNEHGFNKTELSKISTEGKYFVHVGQTHSMPDIQDKIKDIDPARLQKVINCQKDVEQTVKALAKNEAFKEIVAYTLDEQSNLKPAYGTIVYNEGDYHGLRSEVIALNRGRTGTLNLAVEDKYENPDEAVQKLESQMREKINFDKETQLKEVPEMYAYYRFIQNEIKIEAKYIEKYTTGLQKLADLIIQEEPNIENLMYFYSAGQKIAIDQSISRDDDPIYVIPIDKATYEIDGIKNEMYEQSLPNQEPNFKNFIKTAFPMSDLELQKTIEFMNVEDSHVFTKREDELLRTAVKTEKITNDTTQKNIAELNEKGVDTSVYFPATRPKGRIIIYGADHDFSDNAQKVNTEEGGDWQVIKLSKQ